MVLTHFARSICSLVLIDRAGNKLSYSWLNSGIRDYTEKREARLQQISFHQRDRLASERLPRRGRPCRLHQMCDRLVSETTEEREVRLHYSR